MIFADVAFYQKEYLLGRAAIIPPTEFPFWSRKASEKINWRKVELVSIPDELKFCTCEVAETYFAASQAASVPAKRSESVGAYSVSYVDQQHSRAEIEANIDGIIGKWLSNTELHNDFVYRGG